MNVTESRVEGSRVGEESESAPWQDLVTVHSLSWLVVANLVGLWMATLLLQPELGSLVVPLTYGRWATIHSNLQLFGWCSLPLIGLLLGRYQGSAEGADSLGGRAAKAWAVKLWSVSLAVGAVSWLTGHSSGKLFMEWQGGARALLAGAAAFLALVLCWLWCQRLRAAKSRGRRSPGVFVDGVLLLFLLPVPLLLYWTASPAMFPPVNPDSGGATGSSLLGSILGIVLVVAMMPIFLGLSSSVGSKGGALRRRGLFLLLGLHFVGFALLPHDDQSHHAILQILALASTAIWVPILVLHVRTFQWPESERRWLMALAAWGGLLVANGIVAFLPGILERWKFTNAMVGHAHLAMAGFVSALMVLVLQGLRRRSRLRVFEEQGPFWLWQSGTLLMVGSLTVLGILEGRDAGFLLRREAPVLLLYGLRWVAGLMMLSASWRWLALSLGSVAETQDRAGQKRNDLEALPWPG